MIALFLLGWMLVALPLAVIAGRAMRESGR
jgi:hypothetical protein